MTSEYTDLLSVPSGRRSPTVSTVADAKGKKLRKEFDIMKSVKRGKPLQRKTHPAGCASTQRSREKGKRKADLTSRTTTSAKFSPHRIQASHIG